MVETTTAAITPILDGRIMIYYESKWGLGHKYKSVCVITSALTLIHGETTWERGKVEASREEEGKLGRIINGGGTHNR